MKTGVENSEGILIIPVRNEEGNLASVLNEILETSLFNKDCIIIVDNGSTDNSVLIAQQFGVHIVSEPNLGYGNACLAAISFIQSNDWRPGWIMISDGDGSDDPKDMRALIYHFKQSHADLVIGSRVLGQSEPGSLGFIQKFGNQLTCILLKIFYDQKFTDLGPLRMINYQNFLSLELKDSTWGWNIEMHIRALQKKLKIEEIPVNYRKRKFGVSKISGTFTMALRVGIKILFTFIRLTVIKRIK